MEAKQPTRSPSFKTKERVPLELRIIGLPIDEVDDQENNDSSNKVGGKKIGKHAGLDIDKQTGRSCFNELPSSDVVLSELVCSKHANCVDHIGSGTAANANVDSHDRQLGSWALGSYAKRKRTIRGRKQSEVRNTTSAKAGSSSPIRLLSLGSGLENTKAKSSAQAKTKAKEKVAQLSASGNGLGNIAEIPSSSSPSKRESGEPVNTGGTGVNKEAGFVFPPDGYLDLDGLSGLEIPDDIDSWPVEPADLVAFLESPMDDLLDVNRCF